MKKNKTQAAIHNFRFDSELWNDIKKEAEKLNLTVTSYFKYLHSKHHNNK